ncbi:hypothetical protein ACLOJK_029753 [Asimina triloba]
MAKYASHIIEDFHHLLDGKRTQIMSISFTKLVPWFSTAASAAGAYMLVWHGPVLFDAPGARRRRRAAGEAREPQEEIQCHSQGAEVEAVHPSAMRCDAGLLARARLGSLPLEQEQWPLLPL